MRTILAVLLSGALAVSAVAKDRGLGMYLKGQDCIELSNPDLLHYVAGLVDAWLLEAFLTDGERFGWLMECMSNGPESEAAQLEQFPINRGHIRQQRSSFGILGY